MMSKHTKAIKIKNKDIDNSVENSVENKKNFESKKISLFFRKWKVKNEIIKKYNQCSKTEVIICLKKIVKFHALSIKIKTIIFL